MWGIIINTEKLKEDLGVFDFIYVYCGGFVYWLYVYVLEIDEC